IFEPRKLIPFSIEFCNAPIAVMTEITEKTPIVIPIIVRAERNLFAPNEVNAILIVSLNNMGPEGWGTGVMEQWSDEFCCHHHSGDCDGVFDQIECALESLLLINREVVFYFWLKTADAAH